MVDSTQPGTPPTCVLGAADLLAANRWPSLLSATRAAYVEYSSGRALNPLRTRLHLPGNARQAIMSAYSPAVNALGTKLVGLFPENLQQNRTQVVGTLMLVDPAHGDLLAVIDGTTLTNLRTAGSAAAAISLLGPDRPAQIGIIGSGALAQATADACLALFGPDRLLVHSRRRERREAFARSLRTTHEVDVRAVTSPADIVATSEVVICATDSTEPVFDGRDLGPARLVVSIGANTPSTRELDGVTMRSATIVGDSRESLESECGEILIARSEGLDVAVDHEIGELLAAGGAGEPSAGRWVFKAAGLAVQDIVVGHQLLERARSLGLGSSFTLDQQPPTDR